MVPYFTLELPKLFGLPIQIFGVMVAVGFLMGDYLSRKRTIEVGLDPKVMKNIVLICIFVGLFSAHLFDTMFYEPRIFFTDFWAFLDFRTRLSSMGGLIGACVGNWIYLRYKKASFLEYADVVMFGYIPGWFFGRLGCFFVHDHPGRLTDFFLGVKFPGGVRHDLGFHGFYMALCFMLYAPGRFLCDFLRIHDSRMGTLTFAQYACTGMFLIGLFFLGRGYQKIKSSQG